MSGLFSRVNANDQNYLPWMSTSTSVMIIKAMATHLGQLGVPALGLVLEQEGIHAAADGAGDARALAGLEQHHEDQEQGGDDLSDRQNCSNNCHFSKSPFSTAPNQAG